MGVNATWQEWKHLELVLDERVSGLQRYFKNFVMIGFGLADGGGLNVDVGQLGPNNYAYINGYEIAQTGIATKPLADNALNHVFLKFTKTFEGPPNPVTSVSAITIALEVNTTGIPPADSIKLGMVTTVGGAITVIAPQKNKYRIHQAMLEDDLDANFQKIKNLGAPVDPDDAVRLQDLLSSLGDIKAATKVVAQVLGEGDFLDPGNGTGILAAYAALPPAGGTIFVREGDYTTPIPLPFPDKPVRLIGAGRKATRIIYTGVGGTAFSTGLSSKEFVVQDMDVVGDDVTGQALVECAGNPDVLFNRVDITNVRDAVRFVGVVAPEITFRDVKLQLSNLSNSSFWRGAGGAGKLTWDYVEATLQQPTSDAILGNPKWVVLNSYIGGPPPISAYFVGQVIWQAFKVDNADMVLSGADSYIAGLTGTDSQFELQGDRTRVLGGILHMSLFTSFGLAFKVNADGVKILGTEFDGAGFQLFGAIVFSGKQDFQFEACRFRGMIGAGLIVVGGGGTSGNVGGCRFSFVSTPVLEGSDDVAVRYTGNEGFAGSFIIGKDSVVEGVRRKTLFAEPTTGFFTEYFTHRNQKALRGLGTIKNNGGGGNDLEVKETVTDAFGTTDSQTNTVADGNPYLLNPEGDIGTAHPPYVSYKVEVRHPVLATTFDLSFATHGAE